MSLQDLSPGNLSKASGATLSAALYLYAKERSDTDTAFAIAVLLLLLIAMIQLAADLVNRGRKQ